MRFLAALDTAGVVENTTYDKTTAMVITGVLIAAIVGVIVFIFLAFKDVAREYKRDEGAHLIPRNILIKATIFLAIACICLGAIEFLNNYKTYYTGQCSLSELITACLVATLWHWGWIPLVPWLLNMFRRSSLRRTRDN